VLREGLRIVLVVGLIVAIAAFFSGPSVTRSYRGASSPDLTGCAGAASTAGVSTGPVGRWTAPAARRSGSPVVIAGLVFVFWGLSSWVTAVVIAIVLLMLGLIELIGRPRPAAGGRAARR
jgi:hypothetical protein